MFGVVLLVVVEMTVASRTPAAIVSALLPAVIWAIIELQWSISLVESRALHVRKGRRGCRDCVYNVSVGELLRRGRSRDNFATRKL
jgi:hypothetical protein